MSLPPPAEKASAVRSMFSAIAPRYDLLNHLLSLNIDKRWRRRAVEALLADNDKAARYLDACAGTLDLALEVCRQPDFRGDVVASDFALPMLRAGVRKIERTQGRSAIELVCGDALRLPFPAETFAGAIVGFGVRNLASIEQGLNELRRVLRSGGRLVILEFTTPRWRPFRGLYLTYFRRVLPWIGRLVSRHGSAYTYLPESVLNFPEPDRLAALMTTAGLRGVHWRTLTGGIVAIHVGEKA